MGFIFHSLHPENRTAPAANEMLPGTLRLTMLYSLASVYEKTVRIIEHFSVGLLAVAAMAEIAFAVR